MAARYPKRGLININQKVTPKQPGQNAENESCDSLARKLCRSIFNETPSPLNDDSSSCYNGGGNGIADNLSEYSLSETVASDGALQSIKFKDKAEMLFDEYCRVLQLRSSDIEVFDIVQQMAETCQNILTETEKDLERQHYYTGNRTEKTRRMFKTAEWLEAEMKTWKLIHTLYYDRKIIQSRSDDDDNGEDNDPRLELQSIKQTSEDAVVTKLYERNSNVREYQLVVDWLESCYKFQDRPALVSSLNGKNIGWGNTLLYLISEKEKALNKYSSNDIVVKSLDLDAQVREKRKLHFPDEDDDLQLCRIIFNDIRGGNLDDAIVLLCSIGQPLRAMLYQGWRLFDDPNYKDNHELGLSKNEKLPIEGNPSRDIWKKAAFRIADGFKANEFHRASMGALCGHLNSLKSVLTSWEDLLWAYLKVQIDLRVETEIRSCLVKNFQPMPEKYWQQKMSLEKIFEELSGHSDASVRDYANSYIGIMQKYIILDDANELLNQISKWVDEAMNSPNADLTCHQLRFFTHVILFLKTVGGIENEDQAEKVISAYIETLIVRGDAHLVAFYCGCIRPHAHVVLYSKFLERISETTARSNALEEAINMGLDAERILIATVERARNKEPPFGSLAKVPAGQVSSFDDTKIKALEWLTFIPSQKVDLFWHSNAMIRHYLAEGKTECVKAVLKQIPNEGINLLIDEFGTKENLPAKCRFAMKEHLSYKVYITALALFNEWYELYQSCPKRSKSNNDKSHFAEKVASEHEDLVYQQDYKRWSKDFEEQSSTTHDALYNILLFPEGGWLIDPESVYLPVNIPKSEIENRKYQMDQIRCICIPEVVMLLTKILTVRNDHTGCMKLAVCLASERRQLYKNFPKDKLCDFLAKLTTNSMELLNQNLDGWGFPKTS